MTEIVLSIIVPAFNREKTIASTLTSVGQVIPNSCELIVVDDGSTDRTVSEAQKALGGMTAKHQRIIKQRNSGPGAARNCGAAQAKGTFLVFLDSDDLWCKDTLSTLLAAVERVQVFGLMFLQSVDFSGDFASQPLKSGREILLFDSFIKATESGVKTRFASCNVLIPKEVFDAISGFDQSLPCSEDTDLFLRAGQVAPTVVISGDPLIAHRMDQADRLSFDAVKVVQGLKDLHRKNQTGAYGPTRAFLAGSTVYSVRVAFAQGHVGLAYRTLLKFLPLLMEYKPHWVWRLILTPVLALLRPHSYPFRQEFDRAPNRLDQPTDDRAFLQNRVSTTEHWPIG